MKTQIRRNSEDKFIYDNIFRDKHKFQFNPMKTQIRSCSKDIAFIINMMRNKNSEKMKEDSVHEIF